MPSSSARQARLMAAAAHTKGGFGGVSQAVGKKFNKADKGTGMLRPKRAKGEKVKHRGKSFTMR